MIDESVIAGIKASFGDDGSVVCELIELYVTDSPQQLVEATTAIAQQDAQMLRRAAHSLKSTSDMLGATMASQCAGELERLALQHDLAQSPAALDRLTLAVNSAIAALTKMKLDS